MTAPLSPQQINVKPEAAPDAKPQLSKKQTQQAAKQAVKSKKEALPPSKPPIVTETKALPQIPVKKLPRRSSKPIINWFQRKLAGTVRARRASEADGMRSQRAAVRTPPTLNEKSRAASSPISPPPATRARSKTESKHGPKISTVATVPARKPVSFDGVSGIESTTDTTADSDDGRRSSLARDSLWSPTSNYEADEDASVRPLPPSSPPSPSPSRSSSSYLSDPRTFRSMTASTKPTTVLSVDLTGGMAHIAQAPPTPTTPTHRLQPYIRTHSTGPGSGGAITFSAITPPSPTLPSRPSSGNSINNSSRAGQQSYTLQAPQHTTHHPRNNPRPSSPPQDDASVLTLASSAFAMPSARIGMAALALSGRTSLADDSISHYSHVAGQGDSTSHFLLGEMDDEHERMELEGERDMDRDDQDVDASVRALRPRSSRRCSWESEVSKWSASASLALTGVTSQSPVSHGGHRSLWTTGSYRTGGLSVDHGEASVNHDDETDGNGEDTEGRDETSQDERDRKNSEDMQEVSAQPTGEDLLPAAERTSTNGDDASTPPATPFDQDGVSLELPLSESLKSTMATPKGGPVPLREHDAMPAPFLTEKRGSTSDAGASDGIHDSRSDLHSLATTDYQTDAFHTPSTTPIPQ